jgi:sec-independent protein translocase protein TatC
VNEKSSSAHVEDARMPFTGHLEELRSCLIKSLLAVAVGFAVCYAYVENIFFFLTRPLTRVEVPGLTLIGTAVIEAFFTKMKVALIAGLIAALPVVLWQAWRFIAPGLYDHEKRYARSFVFFGTLFFLLGAWFCYSIVFDLGFNFLLRRYEALQVRPAIRVGEYLSFAAKLVLALGVAFELPVLSYFFARVGLIDHRFLVRQFRYAVVIIFILAAILTPPDVISQVLLAIPLMLLYGVSVAVAYFAGKKRE